ncbi:hypothetical protein GCM10007160_32110 [Litchfieldella qijiaojingensis]|uniref:Uncharacterized protein n=1 Tax=Litchfieldella qijiaojingensis TaxID=980347 RepID=A0ABQ2Z358_9GAMM|nr:hypothetical protein GCM10007160_32110 [Halomonas qijiaojingensis]
MTLFGATSGATLNLSYERDRARDRAVNYTNSEVHADRLTIDSVGDTNLIGGTVRAEQDLQARIGGDLVIASRQNRSSGGSAGYGVSAGISLGQSEGGEADALSDPNGNSSSARHDPGDLDTVTGVSGGASQHRGSYVNSDTVVSSLTSGGTADIDVEGNTHLSGSTLATVDEQGNDLGQLNLTTGSLSYDHLTIRTTAGRAAQAYPPTWGLVPRPRSPACRRGPTARASIPAGSPPPTAAATSEA